MLAGAALTAGLRATLAPAGTAEEILHRARFLAHALPPGEGSPTYSGATAWIAHLLALIAGIARWFAGFPAWPTFWSEIEPALQSLVLWIWSALAASILLLVFALVIGFERASGGKRVNGVVRANGAVRATGPERVNGVERANGVERPAASRRRWIPGFVAVAVLLAAPFLRERTAQASPAIPAALLLLILTHRARGLARTSAAGPRASSAPLDGATGAVAAGTADGVALGALLAWAGFAWPVVPVFWMAAIGRRAPALRVISGVLVALVLGLALDPARLVGVSEAGARLWVEWVRGGGWPLSDFRAARDALGLLLVPGAIGWVVIPLALMSSAQDAADRKWSDATWFLLVWAVLALLPLIAGVTRPGVAQQAIVPLGVVAACQLVGRPRRIPRSVAALALVLSAILASIMKPAAADPVALGTQMAQKIAARVGEAPWISERALPGSVAPPGHGLVLPRDSREPARYDFAAWPRWFAGVRFVLVAVDAPPSGRFGAHLRGQLTAQARPVEEFGDPRKFLLFEVQEGTDWTQPLTREELTDLTGGPDLGPFLSSLGAFYAEAGDRRTAVVVLEAGLRVAPETHAIYNNLGSVYLLEGEWEAAARVIGQALERDPNSPELLYNHARAHFELGSAARAEELYRRALAQRPDFTEAHYEIARAFLAQDKKALAVMALHRYLELDRDSPKRAAAQGVLERLEAEPTP